MANTWRRVHEGVAIYALSRTVYVRSPAQKAGAVPILRGPMSTKYLNRMNIIFLFVLI